MYIYTINISLKVFKRINFFLKLLPIIFGVLTVKNDEEALKIASNSKYGLHASVFTQDINRAFHLAKSLPCGTVSVNTFSEGDIKTPFGGYKQSGSLSRDQGTEALNSFLQTKTICISHN